MSRKIIISTIVAFLLAIFIAFLKPECGNGKCEFFESEVSCCIDCGCFEVDRYYIAVATKIAKVVQRIVNAKMVIASKENV